MRAPAGWVTATCGGVCFSCVFVCLCVCARRRHHGEGVPPSSLTRAPRDPTPSPRVSSFDPAFPRTTRERDAEEEQETFVPCAHSPTHTHRYAYISRLPRDYHSRSNTSTRSLARSLARFLLHRMTRSLDAFFPCPLIPTLSFCSLAPPPSFSSLSLAVTTRARARCPAVAAALPHPTHPPHSPTPAHLHSHAHTDTQPPPRLAHLRTHGRPFHAHPSHRARTVSLSPSLPLLLTHSHSRKCRSATYGTAQAGCFHGF